MEEFGLQISLDLVGCNFQFILLGKHRHEDGLDFVWLGSRKIPPYTIQNNGFAVMLAVRGDIPYLDAASNRNVRVRGACSKQVCLPLPPSSRLGVYSVGLATAAAGITATARTHTATMTTRISRHDMATQSERVDADLSGPSG